jgi:hypothetical protein
MTKPQSGESGRVLPLRPRRPVAENDNRTTTTGVPGPSVGDLRRFEQRDDAPDDYRHRMLVNGLAFLVCIFLVLGGVWIATKMAEMRKDQDCVLSGRRGCTPGDVQPHSRY